MLQSIVLGYQLFGRLRDVMPFSSVWDGASSCGLVAAAMAGRLMRLTFETQAHAVACRHPLCHAQSRALGLIVVCQEHRPSLIACAGVEGALLASHGLTGPPRGPGPSRRHGRGVR